VRSKEVEEPLEDYNAEERYFILRCCGCDALSFRLEYHDFESFYQIGENEWEYDNSWDVFPAVLEGHKESEDLHSIPRIVRAIYSESLAAFKSKSYILTGVGFRATVEAICKERGVSGRDLSTKINNLSKAGALSKADANMLHSIRFLGNDAAHEIAAPDVSQLKTALRIIDHMLHAVYIMPGLATQLESVIDNYDDFKVLLKSKANEAAGGAGKGLIMILGRSKRRILSNLVGFEKQLIADIKSGSIDWLKLGPEQELDTDGKKVIVQTYEP
jgi:hypothetical protein